MRHPFPGPGLAIRVICGEERYIEKDYSETQVLVKIIVEYDQMFKKVSDPVCPLCSVFDEDLHSRALI
jgi:GMP synthase, PP-ATPase domain/subunit